MGLQILGSGVQIAFGARYFFLDFFAPISTLVLQSPGLSIHCSENSLLDPSWILPVSAPFKGRKFGRLMSDLSCLGGYLLLQALFISCQQTYQFSLYSTTSYRRHDSGV